MQQKAFSSAPGPCRGHSPRARPQLPQCFLFPPKPIGCMDNSLLINIYTDRQTANTQLSLQDAQLSETYYNNGTIHYTGNIII